jgi:hypothetical protein
MGPPLPSFKLSIVFAPQMQRIHSSAADGANIARQHWFDKLDNVE